MELASARTDTFFAVQPAELPEKGSTVAVGLSGGVDSAVTALLLKEHGCRVIGVTMSCWNNDLSLPLAGNGVRMSCYGADEAIDIAQCAEFCASQGFVYRVIDVRAAYKTFVLEYFKKEYRSGRTPNPCIHCNRHVKFGALLTGLQNSGIYFDYFCTGHYASLVRPDKPLAEIYRAAASIPEHCNYRSDDAQVAGMGRPLMIAAAKDRRKDQTYFLHRIPSEILERVRFPLNIFTKTEIFDYARRRNLAAASRSESQDFIPPEHFDIIFSDVQSQCGDITDMDGKVIGRHRGIEHYTVGQRRGLGVSANKPLYVYSIDAERNRIVLAEDSDLFSDALEADCWVWAGNYAPDFEFTAEVKIRLATPASKARVVPVKNGIYRIFFEKPQRAVAPGQSAVVYLNQLILGGGIISRSL